MWTKILVALVNVFLRALSSKLNKSEGYMLVTFRDHVEIRERTLRVIRSNRKGDETHEG